MSSLFKPFMSRMYPLEVLQQRTRIIDDLVYYALEGAQDRYERKQHPHAKDFKNAVAGRLLPMFVDNVKQPAKTARWAPDVGDTATLISKSYETVNKWRDFEPPFAIPLINYDILAPFQGSFPGAQVHNIYEDAKGASVRAAYDLAIRNISQVEMQIITIHAIADLVRENEYSNEPELTGANELIKTLNANHLMFIRDMLLFGGLLGGVDAADAARKAARYTCYDEGNDISFAVVQFLTAAGRHPGIYKTDRDTKFKADISARYKSLPKGK